jgi:hypothetical protein
VNFCADHRSQTELTGQERFVMGFSAGLQSWRQEEVRMEWNTLLEFGVFTAALVSLLLFSPVIRAILWESLRHPFRRSRITILGHHVSTNRDSEMNVPSPEDQSPKPLAPKQANEASDAGSGKFKAIG